MVIGEGLGYLFVHVPKCAGESIRELLLEPVNGGKHFLRKHATYAQAQMALGDAVDRLETFAVVRNPFEQVLSFYEHLRKPMFAAPVAAGHGMPGDGGLLHPHWACRLAMRVDFPTFVVDAYGIDRPSAMGPHEGRNLLRDQCAWLVRADGSIGTRRILRFERLHEDFGTLARQLGLGGSLPHRNAAHATADTRRYRERFDARSRDVVERHFARTIEEFGYRF